MGLGPPMLVLYKFMQDQGIFDDIKFVAEIGSQEYDTKLPEFDPFLEKFFAGFGADTPATIDPENGRYKGPCNEFYKRLGAEYVAFDIDGRFGSIPFDLNYDRVGPELKHKATLTTNLGTTEHIIDQVSCFRTIHDLTAPGGYMVHALPMHMAINHGLFSYSPCFFEALAAANDYEVLGLWMNAKPNWTYLFPALPPWPAKATLLLTVMRRTTAEDFVLPLQLSNPMMVEEALADRYKTTERRRDRKNWNVDVTYDGVVSVDLEAMTSTLVEDYEELLFQLGLKKAPKPPKEPAADAPALEKA